MIYPLLPMSTKSRWIQASAPTVNGIIVVMTTVLAACSTVSTTPTARPARDAGTPAPAATATQPVTSTQSATPGPEEARSTADVGRVSAGLGDLEAMTFGCPRAGLNAAAREAAKAPTQGNYQFAYFRIIRDSHHSAYEVRFKSNHHGEPDLKYCVAVYCQQGWDQNNSKTSVSLIDGKSPPAGADARARAHGAGCDDQHMRGKRGPKR